MACVGAGRFFSNTLTGTAVHPFYLVGAEEFVPMGELAPGDVLLLADGHGLARVLGLLKEILGLVRHAKAGTTEPGC